MRADLHQLQRRVPSPLKLRRRPHLPSRFVVPLCTVFVHLRLYRRAEGGCPTTSLSTLSVTTSMTTATAAGTSVTSASSGNGLTTGGTSGDDNDDNGDEVSNQRRSVFVSFSCLYACVDGCGVDTHNTVLSDERRSLGLSLCILA
jgi:hypothetical protein